MFTGIVAGLAEVTALNKKNLLWQLELALPKNAQHHLKVGASIAVNGTCLTIAKHQGHHVTFDVMMKTLELTNLNALNIGDTVNVERAARFGDEIGGHLLSGHIHCQAEIVSINSPENNRIITFTAAPQWMPYILTKGFVALDGASITISDVSDNQFCVYLIPETCQITTLGFKKPGDTVNLEIDSQTQAVVETVERLLKDSKNL